MKNLIKITKDPEKVNGFLFIKIDISKNNFTDDSVCILSNDWFIEKGKSFTKVSNGDLRTMGCEIILFNNKFEITLDRFSSYPVYYYQQKKKIIITTLWEEIYNIIDNKIDYVNLAVMKKYEYIPYPETILRDVKRMNINNKMTVINNHENLKVLESRFIQKLDFNPILNPTEVVCKIISSNFIQNKKILIPLTSGLDSRYLLSCALRVTEAKNIETFTYSLVNNKNCFESIIAKQISENNKITWNRISIEDFRKYDYKSWKWNGGIGALNGGFNYLAIEKYMIARNKSDYLVLSGLIGDAISGKFDRTNNLNENNCLTKTNLKMPLFIEDNRIIQSKFNKKIKSWIKCGRDYGLDSNEMIIYGKIQYLSFLWKCWNESNIKYLTPFLNNNYLNSVKSINNDLHINRRWQINEINNLIKNPEIQQKYFFRNNTIVLEEGRKISSRYGREEIKRLSSNVLYQFLGKIYFSKLYRDIELKLMSIKLLEIIFRYIFNYVPTYKILSVLATLKRQ